MKNVFLVHNPISLPVSIFRFLNKDNVSTTYEAQIPRICVFTYNSHLPFTTCDDFWAIK